MEQNDNSNYRTQESMQHKFTHSCLGRLTIFGVFVIILLIIAYYTAPTADVMYDEMMDNIAQCISENDSIKTDWIDDAVNNVGYIFTTADSIPDQELIDNFNECNELKYYRHSFYATTLLHNNFKPEGIRAGIGIFGIVIPTVNFNDFLFRIGPMHRGYEQKIIQSTTITNTNNTEDWSNSADLGL
jgi:hypothetical protein